MISFAINRVKFLTVCACASATFVPELQLNLANVFALLANSTIVILKDELIPGFPSSFCWEWLYYS